MLNYATLKRLHEAATPEPWTVLIEECEEPGCGAGELSIIEIERSFYSCEWAERKDFDRDEANVDLIAYLRNAAPEILELIRDRERLEEVMANGWAVVREPFAPPGRWEVWDIRTDTVAVGDSPRAAIDAAIESTKK